MPNLNVAAAGSLDAFNKLLAWLVGTGINQMAWTQFDTISATDVVLSTSGVPASNRPATLYVRMTLSLEDEAPGDYGAAWDNITFRLYRNWNAGTHSGFGEAGRIGPRLWLNQLSGSVSDAPSFWLPATQTTTKFAESTALNPSNNLSGTHASSIFFTQNQGGNNFQWDGRRFWYYNTTTSLRAYDMLLATDINFDTMSNPAGLTSDNPLCYTVDPIAGRDYLWFNTYTTTSGQNWYRFDIAARSFLSRADQPWFATSGNGGAQSCWDGGDLIYVLEGAVNTGFAVYSISGNSWTSLAVRPTLAGWSTSGTQSGVKKMLYVPASLSGFAHDRIYMFPATFGTGNTTWYYYDVTTDSWASPAALTSITTYYSLGTCLVPQIGAHGKIYAIGINGPSSFNFTLVIYDIASDSWSSPATIDFTQTDWSVSAGKWMTMFRDQAGKLILPTSSANLMLQAQGNKDFFSVIGTWILPASSIKVQRYAYAGFYNTYGNVNSFVASSSISPGTNVTVALTTDPTNKISPGDPILIYDQNAHVQNMEGTNTLVQGGGEVCTVTGVSTNHLVLAHVINSYAGGVILGGDPMPACVSNDMGQLVTLTSGNGYNGDGDADWYRQRVLEPDIFSNIVGPRGTTIGFPVVLYNLQPGNVLNEIIGEFYFTSVGPDSALSTQIAIDEASEYAVFIRYQSDITGDPRPLQLGVINA
jgi:hypothetical protein